MVLIVNDTMRRDRIGIYGGLARTPAFDELRAHESALPRRLLAGALDASVGREPLHGLLPSQHEVGMEVTTKAGEARSLADPLATIAEVLRDAGYRTAAFVSNPWMDRRFGFQQGFDVYDDSFARWGASGNEVTDAALQWLTTVPPDQPFFLYLHYLDSHRPYPALKFKDIEASRARTDADPHPVLSDRAIGEIRRT